MDLNDVVNRKNKVIEKVDNYIEELINNDGNKNTNKASIFSYWLEDYISFLEAEKTFKPEKLKRYKRGEVIKVHLGYNVGSEEGGLHYCIVVEKNNSLYSPVITVVPLTSVKKKTDLSSLRPSSIYLGDEIYTNLYSKLRTYINSAYEQLDGLKDLQNQFDENINSLNSRKTLLSKIIRAEKDISVAENIKNEIDKMKQGSIALVNQITTISKIRIYDPKGRRGVLSDIRISNEKLDLIDRAIIDKLTK